MAGVVPDRIIIKMLKVGVTALSANLTILDDILASLIDLDDPAPGTAELVKIKAYFGTNPPTVVQGYPREDSPFPVFAVVLSSDGDNTEFLGETEMPLLDDNDFKTGDERSRRRSDTYAIYVYATHPDTCAYYYRILKRILEAGTPHMERRGLQLPKISGAELMPDPKAAIDHMFVRRASLTVEYHDEWPVGDALWIALNGAAEEFVSSTGGTAAKIDHYRDDVTFTDDDGDELGQGTLDTYTED